MPIRELLRLKYLLTGLAVCILAYWKNNSVSNTTQKPVESNDLGYFEIEFNGTMASSRLLDWMSRMRSVPQLERLIPALYLAHGCKYIESTEIYIADA